MQANLANVSAENEQRAALYGAAGQTAALFAARYLLAGQSGINAWLVVPGLVSIMVPAQQQEASWIGMLPLPSLVKGVLMFAPIVVLAAVNGAVAYEVALTVDAGQALAVDGEMVRRLLVGGVASYAGLAAGMSAARQMSP